MKALILAFFLCSFNPFFESLSVQEQRWLKDETPTTFEYPTQYGYLQEVIYSDQTEASYTVKYTFLSYNLKDFKEFECRTVFTEYHASFDRC